MEDDDDFGDLYTDVLHLAPAPTSLPANQKFAPIATSGGGGGGGGSGSDEEDEKILHGSSPLFEPVPEFSSIDRERQASVEDADDDWLLGRDPVPVEEPANWVDDDDEVVADRDSKDAVRGLSSKSSGARVLEKVDAGEASRICKVEGDALHGEGSLEKTQELRDRDDELVIPGLATPAAPNGVLVKASESDDWDSGSEDDLQIVLNDTGHDLLGLERRDVGGSDEDDEDLVIVTDDDRRLHQQAIEEQDWGDDAMQSSVDGEKKEMLEVAKASGVAPNVAGAVVGYSNHGFHQQHHSMFKYVRPGATPAPRGPSMAASSAVGQARPPAFGSLSGRGRGDWRPAGGIGFSNMQKGFHSGYGLPTWGNIASGRPFGGGLDFSLPAHKTVFDIDIESFDEKPWRHPGVDISDFFNFGLDEEHWKEYCKQLEQLRLESTMQGKIRVYESGRSEQDYDPDLPPELAAATGHNNMSADNINYDKAENGLADLSDQGKGSACMRPALPTGRPIQVETGFGERLPSIDTRPPRFRDLDAVIEIVLQDNLDDSRNSTGAFEQPENNFGTENQKVCHDADEDERPAESVSEFYGRFPSNSNVQQRELVARRIPTSADGVGILPFPSDSSRQHNSSPKSQSPIDTARSFETKHGGRSLQRRPYGKNSSASDRFSETPPHRNIHLEKHEEHHKERASDAMEVDRASGSPPSNFARDSSMDPKDLEHDERLTLGDSHEGDGGEASDFRLSSETVGDDGLINSANRQKFISGIVQPGDQDNGVGDDPRLTHSDNSRARSGASRDYQKIHETGEEVTQIRPSKHTGDLSKHHEEDDLRQRDDYARDGRREAGRNRSRGRETMHESYAQKDWDSGHTFRGRSTDFERETDGSVGAWHRRDDDAHYRQVKDEDVRRGYNDEIRPRERCKARMIDRKEKIEDHVKKRIDEGDWRGHGRDDGLRHRERNEVLMNRRDNLEDGPMKRKRDVELARRERADKDDSLHGYRVREDSHRKKRMRDDIVDHRKREDDVRTKSKIEERHSSKHKDDNWYQRDREDRQQLNLVHDDTVAIQGREERRFASRSGRPMEKIFAGARRSKEDLKVAGSDKGYHDNDRRRHNEQSKRGDRTGEENESLSKVRGDAHTREKRFNAEQRSMRHERLSAHPDRPSGASDEHPVQKERRRESESSKKVEDSESVGQKGVSGKRKKGGHNSHRTELNSKGSIEPQSNNRSTVEGKKNAQQLEASLPPVARHGDEDPASDGESHDSRRGRSKLERWTSHKERDYSLIDGNIQTSSIVREVEDQQDELHELAKADATKPDNTDPNADDSLQAADKAGGEERDRHLDTVAKLKMRSERFKLPMPGEKDRDLAGNRKMEGEVPPPPPPPCIQSEAVSSAAADADIKLERPARKRKWTGS